MGVPNWLLWIISAISLTCRWEWQWNKLKGLNAAFGKAYEFPENKKYVKEHIDPYYKTICKDCYEYPVVTFYYRIALWPPHFIDKPMVDIFSAFGCHEQLDVKSNFDNVTVFSEGILPVKEEGKAFKCQIQTQAS